MNSPETTAQILPLSRFRAELSRALARRGRDLLEAPEEMASLTPLEAYFVVKELGVQEAAPLLRHATSEQLQTFVDLDCWRDDRPDAEELDAYLAPFAAEGREALAEAFDRLEHEVQIAFLCQAITVYDARSDDVPEPTSDRPRFTTPDTYFIVEAADDTEREVDVLFLVDSLYRAGTEEAYRRLMAAKWELASEIEEQALHFRTSRLEDLGFPSRSEAMTLFAAPAHRPNTVQRPGGSSAATLPALYATPFAEDKTLFTRALQWVSDAEQVKNLTRDLVVLINIAVIAYGERPGDLAHVTEVAANIRDTLSLGLEALLEDAGTTVEPEEAAKLLGTWPLLEIFRYGHREVRELQKTATACAKDPVFKAWLDTHEDERSDYSQTRADRAFVRALLRTPALHSGADTTHPTKTRAFASRQEIDVAQTRLDALVALYG